MLLSLVAVGGGGGGQGRGRQHKGGEGGPRQSVFMTCNLLSTPWAGDSRC